MKKRNQAERNLRINEINRMTIPNLRYSLNSYGIELRGYVKVDDLRNMLIREEGLTERLKTPPTTPQKKKRQEKKEKEIKIDYV